MALKRNYLGFWVRLSRTRIFMCGSDAQWLENRVEKAQGEAADNVRFLFSGVHEAPALSRHAFSPDLKL